MTTASLLSPATAGGLATFAEDFGQRVLLTVDTEEEFDWNAPFQREGYGTEHVPELARFQKTCEEIGAHPLYLVDYPITQDPRATRIIGDALKRGKADLGAQLHAWVTPPFEEELTQRNSYAGNLPPDLERAKFETLIEAIESAFGMAPTAYRAGRYGLGKDTVANLAQAGIGVDTSVRSLFDYSADGGPDYTHHPLAPYWADEARTLLELPITSAYWGVLRQLGKQIHRMQRHIPTFFAAFSKLGLLERIALTPEGVTVEEALRGIDIALDSDLPLLVFSLHSPTLAPGYTPYARTAEDVERIYDWLRRIYLYLDQRGVRTASLSDIQSAAQR